MLKTAGHKGGDGQQNAHDLIDHGLAGGTDPHGQAHKDVTQDAAEEDRQPVDRHLAGGDTHHGIGDRLAVELVNAGHVHQKDDEQGTGKVAKPHDEPCLEHLDQGDLFALERADHKRITGEQLGATHQHQHQAQAKAQAAHDALGTPAQRAVAQKHRKEQTAEGDKRTGEHCQQKGLIDRQVSLGHAGGLGLGLDRGGRQAIGSRVLHLGICHVNHFFPNHQGQALLQLLSQADKVGKVVGGHGVVHGVNGVKDFRGHGVVELRVARLNPYEEDIIARLLDFFDQNRQRERMRGEHRLAGYVAFVEQADGATC